MVYNISKVNAYSVNLAQFFAQPLAYFNSLCSKNEKVADSHSLYDRPDQLERNLFLLFRCTWMFRPRKERKEGFLLPVHFSNNLWAQNQISWTSVAWWILPEQDIASWCFGQFGFLWGSKCGVSQQGCMWCERRWPLETEKLFYQRSRNILMFTSFESSSSYYS